MLNNQSFNMMKALQEAEEVEIKKKITVDSYHEELIESVDLTQDYVERTEPTDLNQIKISGKVNLLNSYDKFGNLPSDWVDNYVENYKGELTDKECNELRRYLNKIYSFIHEELIVEESTEETQKVSKEERLASLKTQLEVDGAQLSDDEKQAIQEEINQLESELNECDTKPMTEESCETKVEENVEINVDSETGDVEVTTDEGENVEVVDETEESDESTDEEIIDEPSEEAPVDTKVSVDEELKEESETPITEQEVTNLREVKNQGNIFMLQDDTKFIVGENYNESEALIENAEIYKSKEEADKDYLDRCEITKDGEPAEIEK